MKNGSPWWLYAIASALCAAVIPILGKLGLKSVQSELATVLRGLAAAAALLVFGTAIGVWTSLGTLREGGTRALVLIGVSGLAGAASWLFYFKAIAVGDVARVAPLDKLSVPLAVVFAALLLGERPTTLNWIGIGLTAVGVLLASAPAR